MLYLLKMSCRLVGNQSNRREILLINTSGVVMQRLSMALYDLDKAELICKVFYTATGAFITGSCW